LKVVTPLAFNRRRQVADADHDDVALRDWRRIADLSPVVAIGVADRIANDMPPRSRSPWNARPAAAECRSSPIM
jgi:hypothetical protein